MGTNALATIAGNQRKIDRAVNGNIVTIFADTTTNGVLKVSTDGGLTWAAAATDIAGFINGSIYIDQDDYLHVVWKQSGTGGSRTDGYLYYMRGTPNAGRTTWTWGSAQALVGATYCNYPDVVAHREGTGYAIHTVHSTADGASSNTAVYRRATIDSGGTYAFVTQVSSTDYLQGGRHTHPSIDFGHDGGGKVPVAGAQHLYMSWNAGITGAGYGVRFRKATYSAGTWTWGTEREIDNTRKRDDAGDTEWQVGWYDGTRVVIVFSGDDGTNADLVIYDRDKNDTTTTTHVIFDNAVGVARTVAGSATYDSLGNVYFIGSDAFAYSSSVFMWTRTLDTWTRTTIESGNGSTWPFFSMKRGAGWGTVEWIYTHGNNSPYEIRYDRISAPTETLRPDSMITETNFSGAYTSLRDATSDGGDATWVTGVSSAVGVLHVSLEDPVDPLKAGAGLQTVRIRVRPSP